MWDNDITQNESSPNQNARRMNKTDQKDEAGLITHRWLPHFTVARLIAITAMVAIGCALYPLFSRWIDGRLLLMAIAGLSVGVLYRNFEGWIIAMLILLFVGSTWITLPSI